MIEREVEKLSTEEQHEYYRKKHALEQMKEETNGREAQASETNAKVQFYYDKIDHPVSLNSKRTRPGGKNADLKTRVGQSFKPNKDVLLEVKG